MTKFTTAKGFSDTVDKAGSKMPDTPMGRIADKWPGDETDEQIAEVLASLQRSSKLNQRLGFLEGLLHGLEMLDDHELRTAIERGMKRYEDICNG